MLNEETRLRILESYEVMDTEPDHVIDELVEATARLLDAPIALVSLLHEERQWFKARYGLDLSGTSRQNSFCKHIIDCNGTFIVSDARHDERFRENPLVTGAPNICAYAGAPLRSPEGAILGSLCVIDDKRNRRFDEREIDLLETLANSVMAQLETRRALKRIESSRAKIEEIHATRERFVKKAAHDLRTPVNIIMGYAQMIRESFGDGLDMELLEQDLDTLCDASELLIKRLNQDVEEVVGESEARIEKPAGALSAT